ncbi:hypothetical protein MLE99_21970 [Escherichia coli]|nr:hypothetical protein [Escherichia coli]
MRKSGLCLTLLFSLIASIKSVQAEAIMISGKLQADMPAVTFNPGPGDFVAFVNNNTITASGTGNACNVTVDDRATSSVDNLVCFFEWLQGDTTYNVSAADTLPPTIYARMRYLDSDELAEESSWKETSARLTVAKPKRLSVSVSGISSVEVGSKVTLDGKYTNPNSRFKNGNDVIEEWTAPDGQKIRGANLSITLTEQMLDKQGYAAFEYSAWLADSKDSTISTRKVSVKSWVYKFPEMKVSTKLKYTMAPSTLHVALSGIKDGGYLGVTYSREWIYDKDNISVLKDDGDTKEFAIAKPGKYTLVIVFRDNRNNEQRIENTFVVDEQTPMTVEMTPKFSNKFMRAPLDVTLRSNIKLAHSADSIDTVTVPLCQSGDGHIYPCSNKFIG